MPSHKDSVAEVKAHVLLPYLGYTDTLISLCISVSQRKFLFLSCTLRLFISSWFCLSFLFLFPLSSFLSFFMHSFIHQLRSLLRSLTLFDLFILFLHSFFHLFILFHSVTLPGFFISCVSSFLRSIVDTFFLYKISVCVSLSFTSYFSIVYPSFSHSRLLVFLPLYFVYALISKSY